VPPDRLVVSHVSRKARRKAAGSLGRTTPADDATPAQPKSSRFPIEDMHWTIDSGWREVADTTLGFIKRFI